MAFLDFFKGSALNAIDAKGRVSVPAEYRAVVHDRYRRAVLREGYDPASGDTDGRSRAGKAVSLVRHPDQPCLIAYDDAFAADYRQKIDQRHADKPPVERERAVRRDLSFFGRSEDVAWDVNGRIVLGPRTRAKAGIGAAVYYFGCGDTFELWDPAAFCAAHDADDPDLVEECRELCAEKGVAL